MESGGETRETTSPELTLKSLTRIAFLGALTLAATSPLTIAQTERGTARGTASGTARGTQQGNERTRQATEDKAKVKRELAEKKKRGAQESKQLTAEERKRLLEAKRKQVEAQKGATQRGKGRRAGEAADARKKQGDPAEPAGKRRGGQAKRPDVKGQERADERRDDHAGGSQEHGRDTEEHGKREGEEKQKDKLSKDKEGKGKAKANPASGQLVTAIRNNRIRMARMDRLKKVFSDRGEKDKVARVDGLRAKESAKFAKKLERFKNALGEEEYNRTMRRLSK